MRLARNGVPAFAHDLPVANDDATDHGVRVSAVAAAPREIEGPRHVRPIGIGEVGHRDYLRLLSSRSGSSDICSRLAAVSEMRCRRLISSSNSVMSWKRR